MLSAAAELGFELADSLFGGGGPGFGLGPGTTLARVVPDLFAGRWIEQDNSVSDNSVSVHHYRDNSVSVHHYCFPYII